jgi:hypothetical protein
MATDKTFNVVGVSKLNGSYKVRFATDIMRIKVLAKHGHEDIRLAELDKAVSKLEAVTQLKTMDEFQDVAAQAAIDEYLDAKTPKAPKAKAGPAVSKAKAAPKAKAPAKAKATAVDTSDMEDAPF